MADVLKPLAPPKLGNATAAASMGRVMHFGKAGVVMFKNAVKSQRPRGMRKSGQVEVPVGKGDRSRPAPVTVDDARIDNRANSADLFYGKSIWDYLDERRSGVRSASRCP